jgi:hypothetical protein
MKKGGEALSLKSSEMTWYEVVLKSLYQIHSETN